MLGYGAIPAQRDLSGEALAKPEALGNCEQQGKGLKACPID
jgi:hypothetical protein